MADSQRLELLRVERLGDRLVEGDHVHLGAALAQAVRQDVAGLGGAGDQHPPALERLVGERLEQRPRRRSGSGTTSGSMPRSRSAAAVPGPIAATRTPASARASRGQRGEEQLARRSGS